MTLTLILQLLVSGLATGAPLAALGLGISLILSVTGRFHFAFALTFTLGAVLAAQLQSIGVPTVVGVLIAVVICAAFGVLVEVVVYRPLARAGHDAGLLPIFVSSLGLTIAGESAVQFFFAKTAPALPFNLIDNVSIALPFGLRTSTIDVLETAMFAVILAGAVVFLRWSRAGRVVRAVRENPTMARAVGVRPESVYICIFAFASALAALAACFAAARSSATPGMGYDPLFSSFVVAFLAGTRAPALRIVLIGIALGVVQQMSTLFMPANLTNIVVFGILFIYLVGRGSGVTPGLRLALGRN
ncbi:branched-subunit amino acid ABC-type transport system permease component [Arthrobacter sp. GAS37]|uniref:branched-chain amino acid ABC transporter permease n=1 Tax=Arthrobacter sp. GAS37 TaxID=3156261 RepID=UPI0038329544